MDKPQEAKEWWKKAVKRHITKLPQQRAAHQEIEQGSQVPEPKAKARESVRER